MRDRDSLNLPSPRQQKADLPIKTLPTRPLYDKLLSPSIRLASTAFQPASKPAATQKSTPSAEPPPLSPRSIIRMKDLSNLELIGEGAQGVVYKAEWTGQTVIYKKVKLQTKTEGEDKKNFQREFSVWQYVSFIFITFPFQFIYFLQALDSPVVCIAVWNCKRGKRIRICR